jgi:hypothetical protein
MRCLLAKYNYSRPYRLIYFALSLHLLAGACNPKNKYEEMVEAGLVIKVRYNSLFFGLHFNMTPHDFYEYCFEMNQQGIFFQNPIGL